MYAVGTTRPESFSCKRTTGDRRQWTSIQESCALTCWDATVAFSYRLIPACYCQHGKASALIHRRSVVRKGIQHSKSKLNGRAGEIRTHDLLHPMQARYQATLQPELGGVTKTHRPE